ncbi:hypothetical protein JIR001_14980 [Polycladomyces abyssicola]|uniref:Uncharacterized protein n=1 Tax=Polycladomyces abyssicola TaxID=1125966 RepID=A0A8D5UGX2_9BACL|nr:YheC/YheD family protein [Polycladomyces abyssicola]BCU81715.1 hypothetical protein JIR001_14980 [Polycladomyces abyssicola]
MIGVILSSRRVNRADSYVLFYMNQARKQKVDLCFYSPKHISVKKNRVKGYVYSHKNNTLKKRTVPVPKFNLYKINYSLRKKSYIRKINRLREKGGSVFYNCCSKKDRSKYKDYKYLVTFKQIRPYLPQTKTLQYDNLINMLDSYNKVFIKPKRGGQGNNIYIIRNSGDQYDITHIYKRNKKKKSIPKNKLGKYIQKQFVKPYKFIIQQGIQVQKYKGRKFDFRVSPQKNKHDRWQITGITPRVAAKGWDVTNVDQGGEIIYNVKKLINKKAKKQIYRASILISKALEERFTHLNDLGLDLAVDHKGKVWFFEANFRPNRKKVNIKRNRIPFEHVCSMYKKAQ